MQKDKIEIIDKHDFKNASLEKGAFYYDLEKSNWLTVRAIINKADTATFVFDNNGKELVCFDMEYALKSNLIKNKDGRTISRFLDSSEISLSFGNFDIQSKSKSIGNLPRKKTFKIGGLLGMDFLKNYALEINFQDRYFRFDSTFSIDTTGFFVLDIERKGLFAMLPVDYFVDGKKYRKKSLIDLGYEGPGIRWNGSAVKGIPFFKKDNSKVRKAITTMTGEIDEVMPYSFDSIILPGNLKVANVPSRLSFSSQGVSGNSQILLGNGFLKRFGIVFIDFRNNKLYLKKNQVDNNNNNNAQVEAR